MAIRKSPIRTCISCRVRYDQMDLYRFSLDGTNVEVDQDVRGNGRGAYVCLNSKCLTLAMNSDRLDRALKASISGESKKRLITFILDS